MEKSKKCMCANYKILLMISLILFEQLLKLTFPQTYLDILL